MSNTHILSNIFWQNKITNKEKVVFLIGEIKSLKKEILKDNFESFIKISKNNSLSKFTIISSVFSFVINKYFENYQGIMKVYPSHSVELENFLLLEIQNNSTTFKELLQDTATEVKEVFSHKNYTFSEFDLELFSNFSIQFGQKAESLVDDISLVYEEIEDNIVFTVFYKENYPDYVIESLLKNVINILSDYEELLNKNKKGYSFVDKAELHQLLVEFNNTKVDYPSDKTIVDLFEDQVDKTPNNIALVFEDTELTYRGLNEKANQLAYYIKDKHAIENGHVIATLLPKSIDLLISLLAIEKLGCIYLPIDINYPKDRIEYILEDSKAKILLSEKDIVETLGVNQQYISVKSDEVQFESKNNINIAIKPNDIAYLIYTSGSTGKPKGVLVEHHSNINMSLDQIKTFEVTAEDKIVWFASVAFDASISEIMMSLYLGATLCIPTEEEQKDKDQFISFLQETKSTVVTFPPSYLELLSKEDLKSLKTIITAGESANPIKAKEIVENGINYYNAYGPTEYSVCTSIFKLTPKHSYSSVPIGAPISNTQVYILDEDLRVVPVGVSGTLYVSGIGLSRGYLNKPELTAEKFIDNPFEEGTKMYDTGDLARWLPDGNIEFLGRKDFQVKIRGYRIELGEIETNISQFSFGIKQVVGEAKEVNGEKVLVAYYTKDEDTIIDKTELREYLQSKLPEYMVPGFFVELESIPLTPNGKIDRKALPSVSGEDLIRREYVAPKNATEEKLAEIWQEVLGVEKVGITDNFFELGGHSLMVAQVLNRIHQNLSMQVSFKDFFASPSIEGIAKSLTGKEYTPIPKVPEQESYPLTPSQQRLWVLSQLEGGSQAYNMPAVVTLRGELNEVCFEKSFQSLIGRHEILRTSFKSDKATGEIRQYITPKEEVHFTIEVLDYVGRHESEVEDYLQSANNEAFNLEESPLIRATLLRRDNKEHLFFLSMHHIIGDGWSTEVLVSEVVENYNNLLDGNTNEDEILKEELAIQYKDYAVWLQEEIKEEKYRKAEFYWLEQFEGELPVLELPSYKTRPLIQTYNGNNISHLFSKEFTEKLKQYSEQHGATLFMTLMAGVKALLYRYTGQQDIIVGTPIAGREHPDLENQIGLYLNTLAIRTRLEEDHNTFESLLKKEKETLLSAYEHQLYPFDELVGKLNIKRDTSRSALFDVLVVFQNQGQLQIGNAQNNIEGLQVEEYDYHRKTSQFDVSYTFAEEGKQLGLTIEYNTDIYDEFLIQRMFAHFENLLTQAIEHTEDKTGTTAIESIDFLTEQERHELLVEFNDTKVDYPSDKTIIELFEEQVEKTPDNVAVVFEDTELTYRELNEQANELGDYLRQNYHIQPDDLVTIKLERSEKMIVVILGILKSGAAYVPIDPEYPQERIEYIEHDTQAKISIDKAFLESYQEELKRQGSQYTRENLPIISRPDSLAYVIYTSGTTGQPKGVMIENRSVVSIYECWKKEYELEKIDIRLLQLASISFDVFVGDICRSILNGGKMVICPNNVKLDVQSLYGLLKKNKISILEGTPALLLGLCNEIIAKKLDFSFLKIFIFGSDSFNNQDFLSIRNQFGNSIKVINSYGVTEATIDSTFFDDEIIDFNGATPIGKPFSNSKIYIGSKSKLSPIGVYDKLYISGIGLSRGYLNKPELTAEKFIDNPFEEGTKMYDTGDLARWLPDGNIEFLGRKDFQVKIRGYRIELGEIETNISQFSFGIKQVVGEAKEVNGEKVLVAYYTKDEDTIIDKTELREYLQSKLPEYMVPGFFVELESIPLTPNGKIDRKALPSVSGEDLIRREYVAPKNATEEKLAEIWQEVLGVEKVGITDNFFELGGHSLMVAQVLNRIHQNLSMQVSFKDFFASPSIEGIAKSLTGKEYTPIPKVPEQESYPLTPSQQRLWVLSQLEGGSQAYNMPAVVTLRGELNEVCFEKSFQSLIGRHEILRTSFKSDKATGEIRQYITPKEEVHFTIEVLDYVGRHESEVEDYLQSANNEAFNLEESPLIRATLLRRDNKEHLFFLSMHHIIGDGWSTEVLVSEVVENYNNLLDGNTNEDEILKEELAIQYKDYAVWLQEEIKEEKYRKAEFYWLEQFEGELPVLELPSYKTRPLIQTYNGNNISHLFSKEFTEKLKQYSEQHGATLFMTLMAGVKALLYRYTGQQDIIVGTPIAGREHPDLENQIGLYLNTLAIRTRLEEDHNTFESLLKKEKETLLSAYEHQLYPFDELVGKLNIKRDTSRSALFDVLVVFQNQGQLQIGNAQNNIEGLQVEEYDYHRKTSQFDVSYTFAEEGKQLGLTIEYNTDIYDEFLIQRMFAHFENLLTQAIEHTEDKTGTTAIESIDFLTEQERHELLVEFNDTKVDYPSDKTIIELFEEQVEKTPENIALIDSEVKLSYKELKEKSDSVANYLTSNLGENNEPVGVLVDRSAELIVLLLGILKSGKCYIPIDPMLPKERIEYIINHSQASVIITEETYLWEFNSTKTADNKNKNTANFISKEKLLQFEKTQEVDIHNIPKPNDTAYIIYTSGSTGNPKGVEIGHHALTNFLISIKNKPKVQPQDILYSVTTYSFDISILEFFTPLISGASVFIASKETLNNVEQLKAELANINPTIIQATPSFYQMLFNAGWNGNQDLKILCGGESLNESLAEKLLNHSKEVWNMYGPTETTIWSSTKKIEKPSEASNIGKPINNTQIYIVDKHHNLLPQNTVGRIFIAGDGLAKGYYKNETLTQEKFINNPFSTTENDNLKMYETGDLGKWNEKGEIEFLGRNDFQVKVRGFRIELGEIETKLQEYPNIKQAVVDAKEVNGEKVLVAYYTKDNDTNIDKTELREYLQSKLPEYMVPGFFVELEDIPLTPNGKIDRKSLPSVTGEDLIRREYVAPRNETEEQLAEIWQEVLGVDKVGITDNFFELGGHSLAAIKVTHSINEYFNVNISLNQLFEQNTIKQLAIFIDNIKLIHNLSTNQYEESESETFTI